MIQDIAPHIYDNTYRPVPPGPDSYALSFEGREVLARRLEDSFDFPRFKDLESCNDDIYEHYTYLFSIDGEGFYLVSNINRDPLSPFSMENTEMFRAGEPQHLAFAGITAYQLYRWYQSSRYCGTCGSPLRPDEKERMMYCEHCHARIYPKISPAVIIGLTDGSRLLLSKYAGRTYTKYALLAGFVEIGESIEETVRREVMEEVGLKVKNIRYYRSQPWSFSETVLMGFYCDLDGDDQITLDTEELALAEWFQREDIPVTPSRDSLTNEMIIKFKQGYL